MRTRMEMETDTALGIVQGLRQSVEELERWWPPSRRGSNAQRILDQIKEKHAAIEKCLLDAMK